MHAVPDEIHANKEKRRGISLPLLRVWEIRMKLDLPVMVRVRRREW
jgi:hypothetical protein